MSNASISIDPRARAVSFVAAAALVALACALLLIVSRVVQYADDTSAGVRVFIEEAPPPAQPQRRAGPPPPRGGMQTVAPDAPPTPTDLPVDRAMLARALNCFDRLNHERSEDCPREALEQEYGDVERMRRAYDPSPPRMSAYLTPSAVPPPCVRGVTTTTLAGDAPAVQYCGGWGITPPPPSRSAEEVCVAGGIGPCHPPPFRPEDVERLRHTQ